MNTIICTCTHRRVHERCKPTVLNNYLSLKIYRISFEIIVFFISYPFAIDNYFYKDDVQFHFFLKYATLPKNK